MLQFHLTDYGEEQGVNLEAVVGLLPTFLTEASSFPAASQIDRWYTGGFRPFKRGFELDQVTGRLTYPGDPPMMPLARAVLHGKEEILVYESAWIVIVQRNGSWVVARVD